MSHPLRWLALVTQDTPALPELGAVAERLAAIFPDAPPLVAAGATENLITCSLGEYTVAATLVSRPIPWSQLEGPCATAWYWPDAADALRDHSTHLMVTLIDEGSKAAEKSICLTQFVTALVAAASATAVFWGPGRLVHQAQAFVEQAQQTSPDNLPLFLWIDFRIERAELAERAEPEQAEDGCLRLFTTGLDALGQPELEVPRYRGDPQQLLENAYNVAHYLLDQRKVVNDGDTIGLTDALQATACLRPSMFDAKREVLQLAFDSTGA